MMGKKASGKHLTESRKNIVVTEKASFDQPQTNEQVMNRGANSPLFFEQQKKCVFINKGRIKVCACCS